MKYTISWLEKKVTSTGKEKADVTLQQEDGQTIDKVTIWADFPNFSELRPGHTIEGNVVTKQNGKFTNKTFYQERTNTSNFPQVYSWPKGPQNTSITKAMDTKRENIKEAQETKQEAIKLAGSARDATLLTIEWIRMQSAPTDEEIKTKWKEYRMWLFDNFGDDVPFL